MLLIGAVVCLLVAYCGSNCSLTRAMNGRIVRCVIISSAASFDILKCFWQLSPSHVRSAIGSTGLYFTSFCLSLRSFAHVCDEMK